MDVIGIKNMQLDVSDVETTRQFYRDFIGLNEINFLPEPAIAIFEVGEFILRFEQTDAPPDGPIPIRFIGLELGSFDAVDAAYEEVETRYSEENIDDVRKKYVEWFHARTLADTANEHPVREMERNHYPSLYTKNRALA